MPAPPTIAKWFEARWRAFQASYDPDAVLSGSTLAGTALVTSALVATILVLTYVPVLAATARLQHPWIAIALALLAGSVTVVSGRFRCRGRIGTLAALVDNPLWSLAMVYLAVNAQGGYAIGVVIIHALAVLTITVQHYSLTLLFGCAELLPSVLLLLAVRPPAAVSLIVSMTGVMALWVSHMTGQKKRMLQRHRQLQEAFGAADKVADESMQAALATMLLSLGHFLHELRNYQTAISTNLSYLEETSKLDQESREALQDARLVQAAEQKLVYETIEELKRRSQPVLATFLLKVPIELAAADARNVRVVIGPDLSDTSFVLHGNPEHLKLVLHNLIRNAAQAGANEVHIDLHLEASGQACRLLIHDDGPGISASRRHKLFEPFAASTTLEGTGLGLYLCRRYVGLFGGTVAVEEGPLGGACFIIRLPGSIRLAPASGEA